jgi:hypothetical protein
MPQLPLEENQPPPSVSVADMLPSTSPRTPASSSNRQLCNFLEENSTFHRTSAKLPTPSSRTLQTTPALLTLTAKTPRKREKKHRFNCRLQCTTCSQIGESSSTSAHPCQLDLTKHTQTPALLSLVNLTESAKRKEEDEDDA